nr:MAG TPA: hypothetical protein [Caudoviricetes sp.]DAT56299.1 MAG TPA: hypothetical protein [Caudoviricetes sp.]
MLIKTQLELYHQTKRQRITLQPPKPLLLSEAVLLAQMAKQLKGT